MNRILSLLPLFLLGACADGVGPGPGWTTERRLDEIHRLGDAGADGIPGLLFFFRHPDFAVHSAAGRALATPGSDGIPGLLEALEDPDPAIRRRAVSCLGLMGENAGPAVEALVRTLDDSHASVSYEAIFVLGSVDIRRAATYASGGSARTWRPPGAGSRTCRTTTICTSGTRRGRRSGAWPGEPRDVRPVEERVSSSQSHMSQRSPLRPLQPHAKEQGVEPVSGGRLIGQLRSIAFRFE